MEDYIFKTYFKMTYEEYKKMFSMSIRKNWKIYLLCISLPLIISITDIKSIKEGVLFTLIYILIFTVILFVYRKVMYSRNSRNRDFEETTYFYEDRLEADTPIAHIRLPYSDLERIIETQTNFYLYISKRSMLIVSKSDCLPDNISFIQNVAKTVNKK
ncbi:MAG: YcxB family protein [Lachnospiraceae bacterium]|nr:YcxB family protein [Lachnospiraceae bacterium]